MDALIIAAGAGSRLRSVADAKPLAPIHGMTLIEIGVLQAARAGVRRAVVTTGYHADAVEAALPAISARAGIPVVPQRVDDWRLPNGYSVMAGASQIGGNYLLLMADHIFADPILLDLLANGAPSDGVTLAIDRRTDGSLIDPGDATWVDLDDRGGIVAIGKEITSYCAVDCGAFVATPALARAIAEAIADGRPGSLSDGMQRLADQGRAATMDIGASWWIDVDDPRAYALAQTEVPTRLPQLFDADVVPAAACEQRLVG
ncbi:NTP transferase domain-containing protein [Sphingopyxis kveilinensis]|uniref:phosphocholine cytidylyltransferase family protein n=1 Tax=Sphingopyxis kveilinensis TaxID=3114367 RepID=UPI0030D36005